MTSDQILEELPVHIRNSSLVNAFLSELKIAQQNIKPSFDILTIATDPYIDRNIAVMNDFIDDMGQENYRLTKYLQQVNRQQQQMHQMLQKRVPLCLSKSFSVDTS